MKREAGYTLLEIMVVLVIMAILTAALPGTALPVIDSMRASGKVQRIIYQLRDAHTKAMETGKVITLMPSALVAGTDVVHVSAPHHEIVFFPDGSASGGRIIFLYRGHQRVIDVDALTGIAITN